MNIKSISGTHEYSLNEIFNTKFMKSNTKFDSIEEFLKASPEHITTQEGLDTANKTVLNQFVSEHSDFSTWEDMLGEAAELMILRQLGI